MKIQIKKSWEQKTRLEKAKEVIGVMLVIGFWIGIVKLSFYLFPNATDFLWNWFSY